VTIMMAEVHIYNTTEEIKQAIVKNA